MERTRRTEPIKNLLLLALLLIPLAAGSISFRGPAASYIVQAADIEKAAAAVEAVGGKISHELNIIDAVGARLGSAQLAALKETGLVQVYQDRSVEVAKKPPKTTTPTIPDSSYPTLVSADILHDDGITGAGVTVAVLDTGWDNFGSTSYDTNAEWRVLESYDAIQDTLVGLPWRGPVYYPASWGENDGSGHASHITSIIASSRNTNTDDPISGLYHGVAPDASYVVVKAFDRYGAGSYLDVIRGIDWVVANKDSHNIRILNFLSAHRPSPFTGTTPSIRRSCEPGRRASSS